MRWYVRWSSVKFGIVHMKIDSFYDILWHFKPFAPGASLLEIYPNTLEFKVWNSKFGFRNLLGVRRTCFSLLWVQWQGLIGKQKLGLCNGMLVETTRFEFLLFAITTFKTTFKSEIGWFVGRFVNDINLMWTNVFDQTRVRFVGEIEKKLERIREEFGKKSRRNRVEVAVKLRRIQTENLRRNSITAATLRTQTAMIDSWGCLLFSFGSLGHDVITIKLHRTITRAHRQ